MELFEALAQLPSHPTSKLIIPVQCCKYITLLRDTVGSTEDEEEKL